MRSAHVEVPGAPARIGVSIGIATAPQDACGAKGLLHAADQAMYAAKFSGGHRTRLARDGSEDAQPRSVPQREMHVVETIVRWASDGATSEERQTMATAQRWVLGVVSHLEGGAEAAPQVTMAAGACSNSAMRAPTLRSSSGSGMKKRLASSIAWITSGGMIDPPRTVTTPTPLMTGLIPRLA